MSNPVFDRSSICAQLLSGTSLAYSNAGNPIMGTVYGTLLNVKDAYQELESHMKNKPYQKPPEAPILYIKPRNTYNQHKGIIWLPKGTERLRTGPSLGIVIGKTTKSIVEDDAMDYIQGYTIVNDISIEHDSLYRPPIRFNARDGFCPIGPDVKKASLVTDPHNLRIDVYINEQLSHTSYTSELIRSIPALLTDVTEFMTLYPGDILMVGVSHNPPVIHDGDLVRVTIEQIGSLENQVMSETQAEQEGK
ncbi:fumarylacetoacetate hydrolase family protein [Bacillus sp. FJAT-27916]|uniref:fumarylacetoacetate hydrolase family protein n=1 Tax=Bacillus sp. FJAT-27916 TaxID=1679169 RepID=UPI00069D068E|nr:fumarylacetoacetate hydrolase family protein [Bacillus sp. FJAT-27916]